VLYELLTGEPPFVANNYPTLILKIVTEPFPSARAVRPSLPVGFDELLRRAGSRVPEERPQTARDFAIALRASVAARSAD
jgi:serine/threonine-protein kinase